MSADHFIRLRGFACSSRRYFLVNVRSLHACAHNVWKDTDLLKMTSSGATPFLAACEGGRVDVVRTLMERATGLGKLDEMCNTTDAAGKTPFDMAAAGQHKVRGVKIGHKAAYKWLLK